MHQQRFIILRDNKENGPFSLTELNHFALLPTDLIWIEGISNGWTYAKDTSILKPYLQSASQNIVALEEVADDKVKQGHELMENEVEEKAKHIYVSMPNTNKVTIINGKISLADRLEKKAQEIYKRVQAYNQQNTNQPIDAPKQFGVRTLNDLRKQYTDWKIAKSKEKRYKNMFRVITLVAVALLLVATYFTWMRTRNEAVFLNDEVIRYSASPEGKSLLEVNEQPVHASPLPSGEDDVLIPEREPQEEASSVDAFIDSVNNVLAEQGQIKLNIKSKPTSKIKTRNTTTSIKSDTIAADSKLHSFLSFTENAAEVSHQPTAIHLKNLVSISTAHQFNKDAGTLKDLQVTVHNHSAEHVVDISVDVFYYKRNGRLINTETLRFSNLQPSKSSTLAATISKKAASAKCKINAVSSIN